MSAFVSPEQYDVEIEQHQNKVAELQKKKEEALKKEKALSGVADKIEKELTSNGATIEDFFARFSVRIGDWLTSDQSDTTVPELKKRLLNHFTKLDQKNKAGGKRRVTKARAATSVANGLDTGKYHNPLTGEDVEKKRRAPKLLDQWVTDHGLETVKEWLVK